jgi:hypothetical protein
MKKNVEETVRRKRKTFPEEERTAIDDLIRLFP